MKLSKKARILLIPLKLSSKSLLRSSLNKYDKTQFQIVPMNYNNTA